MRIGFLWVNMKKKESYNGNDKPNFYAWYICIFNEKNRLQLLWVSQIIVFNLQSISIRRHFLFFKCNALLIICDIRQNIQLVAAWNEIEYVLWKHVHIHIVHKDLSFEFDHYFDRITHRLREIFSLVVRIFSYRNPIDWNLVFFSVPKLWVSMIWKYSSTYQFFRRRECCVVFVHKF